MLFWCTLNAALCARVASTFVALTALERGERVHNLVRFIKLTLKVLGDFVDVFLKNVVVSTSISQQCVHCGVVVWRGVM